MSLRMKHIVTSLSIVSIFAATLAPTVMAETGFAPVRGGRLHYEIAGTGDPIVFVHGNEGDCRHWDAQFEAFAKEFRVVRYDVRGFGRSSGNFPQPLTPPAAGRLAELRVPTLIMTAEHDVPACFEAATLLSTSVPDARKVVMPGTGHLLHIEKPAEFNRHVIRFLREIATPRK